MALRILLADDSMTAQNMGKKILTDAGYEVVTVSNGAAAVKKIAEVTPDLAILDVYMPGYNGLEVCDRVKSSPATASIPVLLSVGKMEPFRPEDGMKVKANGVIIKPFEATDLVTVVEKLASRVAAKPEPSVAAASAAAAATAVAASAPASISAAPSKFAEPVASAPAFAEEAAPAPTAEPEDTDAFGPAPALQTFESANDPVDVLGEPHLESHAATPTPAVEAVTPPEFEATAIQSAEAASARSVMTEVALMDGFSFGTDAAQEEPNVNDVLSDEDREFLSLTARPDAVTADPEPEEVATPAQVAAPEHAQPAEELAPESASWHAQEEELTDDDLALDLEDVMRNADSKPEAAPPDQAAADPVVEAPSEQPAAHTDSSAASAEQADDSVFDPFVDLVTATNIAPERSTAAPVPAPIGKTSFDEFDAIMEQASAKFESPAESPSPTGREAVSAEPEADILLADELDGKPEASALGLDLMAPDLMIEEAPVANDSEAAPPSMHRSDALSGVFDLDAPAQPDPAPAAVAEAEEPVIDAGVVTDAQPIELIEEAVPEQASPEMFADKIAALPEVAEVVPVGESAETMPDGTAEPAVAEHATDLAVAAVNAEIQSVAEGESHGPVERVVERVVDRLRPMLTIMVEEIMKELKR